MTQRIAHLWRWLRRLSGDDAYDRYIAHQRAAHADHRTMTRAEFYAHRENDKWSGVNRCC
jgi:uncharacterized short protein YbdD (DUF466 family)